ncbi:MAG: TonB-dependent receptor [Hellea sp.]|nr:TonB-dependent receptor [Hellea sp.]
MNSHIKKYLLQSTMLVGALTAGFATGAVAQDSEDDEIVVTGSRIVRADLDSASPITVVDRQDLVISGISDVGDLIQTMPSMAGSPIGTTTNNGGNGSVRVDLRGFGTARTLTLVDGKRMVDQGDFQTVPGLMIERVDILKDGASAIYGADAVSGVVNVITRKDFEGVELVGQYNMWDKTNNGEQYTLGALAGTTFDRGSVSVGVEYVDQQEVYQRDVPWDFFQDSFYIYPEGCENQLLEPWGFNTDAGCFRIGSSRIPESRLGFMNPDGSNGSTFLIGTPATQPYEVGLMIPHDGRNYNYAPVNYMQTPYQKLNIFANTQMDLGDDINLDVSLRTNKRTSAQELAPMPFNSPTDPAHSGVFNGVAYNGIHQDNYYLRQAIDAYNAANGTALPYTPVRDARRRMIETTRRFTQDVTQTQLVASLDGEIDDIKWEVFANHGYRNVESRDFGQFNGPNLFNALGPSADLDGDGQPECYGDINDPSTLIAGCVPFNFFGGGSVVRETGEITASTLTQDMIDYVSANLIDRQKDEFSEIGVGLTGDMFELPNGPLGWAVGAGYWERELSNDPDSAKQAGQVTGNTGAATQGSLENYNAYMELFAPVWGNGTQRLDLKAGVRYDDFTGIGDDITWQVGAELQALDSLKLRGTAGTVFRVPTIFNLFGGVVDSFPTYSDPCAQTPLPAGCAQTAPQLDTQVLAKVGGNPNLRPETGDSLTLGAVFTPDVGDLDMSVTVDYFDISLDDGIGTLGVNNILRQCHLEGSADACALITRRPDYSVAQIVDAPLNVAALGVEGIDTEVRMDYPASFGDISGSFIWTHLLDRSRISFPGQPLEDLAGRYDGGTSGAAYAKDKFNYSLGWAKDGMNITYRGEYIGGVDADTFCNCDPLGENLGYTDVFGNYRYDQEIDSQLYHDIILGYDWEDKGLVLTGGVTNVTNEEPPFIETGFNAGTEPAVYRVFGRGFYVRAQKTF